MWNSLSARRACRSATPRAAPLNMRETNGGVGSDRTEERRLSVPVIYVTGSHYEVGYDVGRTFGTLIKALMAESDTLRDLEREYKTDVGRGAYDKTLVNMKKRFPYYVKEIQGVAEGANVPFYQLFLLQMDDIMTTINEKHAPRNDAGGCTTIAFKNNNSIILGHNEDAFKETLNHFYIISAHIIPTQEDKDQGAVEERFASLCYAGHLPGYTMGFNQHGLVFSINTLSPLNLKPGHTPRTFLTRKVLSSRNFRDAESILRDEGLGAGNGCSMNMMWSDACGDVQLYNVEMAPDVKNNHSLISVKKFEDEPLVHCNKYQHLEVKEVTGLIIESSNERLKAICSLPPPATKHDVHHILSDTSGTHHQVFSYGKDVFIKTIVSTIFDVDKRTWSVYINKAEESEPVAVLPIRFAKLHD